jgi:hypothetical protein
VFFEKRHTLRAISGFPTAAITEAERIKVKSTEVFMLKLDASVLIKKRFISGI